MTTAHERGQLDWLVELMGAAAPAMAAAFAAARLAPPNGWPIATAVLAAGGGVYVAAFAAMRIVPAEKRHFALTEFETRVGPEDELVLDDRDIATDELLLDQPLVESASEAVAELLLDDPLPAPAPDSRVVHLFAEGRIATAGQLKHQIDRHLAGRGHATMVSPPDASDALSEALTELRRSLRQA